MSDPVEQKGTAATAPVAAAAALPLSKVVPWAILGGLFVVVAYYFIGAEQGATALVKGSAIHEFVHDARHLLGFPCH